MSLCTHAASGVSKLFHAEPHCIRGGLGLKIQPHTFVDDHGARLEPFFDPIGVDLCSPVIFDSLSPRSGTTRRSKKFPYVREVLSKPSEQESVYLLYRA
jgi:hypothetical protein